MKKVIIMEVKGDDAFISTKEAPNENDLLPFIYQTVDASTLEIVYASLEDGREFDIWVDSEGLLKQNKKIFQMSTGENLILVGSMVITNGVGSNEETIFFDDVEDKDLIVNIIKWLIKSKPMGITN